MDRKAIADALEFARENLRCCQQQLQHYAPGSYSAATRKIDEEYWTTIVQALEGATPDSVQVTDLQAERAIRDNNCRGLSPIAMLELALREAHADPEKPTSAVLILQYEAEGSIGTTTYKANLRRSDELALLTLAQRAAMHRMMGDG